MEVHVTLKDGFFVCLLLASIVGFLYTRDLSHAFTMSATPPTAKPIKTNRNVIESNCRTKIRHGTDFTIIYNAMPKTGSRSLSSVLATAHNENFADAKHKRAAQITSKEYNANDTAQLKTFYKSVGKEAVVIRGHNSFVPMPPRQYVYINMIREPIPWIISRYYYARNGDARKVHLSNDSESFDECISRASRSCAPSLGQYLRFFCGDRPECRTEEALEISKSNLRRYLVVGLTDAVEDTIRVMEILLPDLYEGATAHYSDRSSYLLNQTSTVQKTPPTNATLDRLKNNPEVIKMYEFYEHVKRRFNDQHICLQTKLKKNGRHKKHSNAQKKQT